MKKLTCPNPKNISSNSLIHNSKFIIQGKKGFTLIELLVVIAILAILAVVVAIAINPAAKINSSKDAKIKSDIGQIAGALQAYFTSVGTTGTAAYPATTDLQTQLTPNYLGALPYDPTGGYYNGNWKYTYRASASGDKAIVYAQNYGTDNTAPYFCWDSTTGSIRTTTIPGLPNTCP